MGHAVLDDDGADVDAGVEIAGVADPADRAAVAAALDRLELVDDLHRADLGRARQRARRQHRAQRVERADVRTQATDHRRDDVHHVAVVLDGHELLDLDAAVLAHPAEVVAAEVDQHHVLGALLRVGEQLLGHPQVLLDVGAARPGTGDRPGRDVPARDRDQRLGAGAGELEVAEVEEVHVRARVDGPQPAIDRERLNRDGRRPPLRGHDLVGVAGVDVLDDPADHRLELLARHVRGELGHGAVGRRRPHRTGHRAGQTPAHLGDRLNRTRVGGLEVVVGVHVDQHGDRVLEVIEHDQRVGQHQREVGNAELVRVGLAERLDRADEVVGEHADGAAGERRQVGQRRRAEPAQLGLGQRVRVTGIAERPAQHVPGTEADERVAPDPALVGRLEQERRSVVAQLQERRHRRLAVVDERLADRNQVVRPRQRAHLLERRRRAGGRAVSGDGHRAPARRRPATGPGCAAGPRGDRSRPRPPR